MHPALYIKTCYLKSNLYCARLFANASFKSSSSVKSCFHTTNTMESSNNLSASKPIIAVAQMRVGSDKEANYSQGCALIQRAKTMGAQMVFLPECCDHICESRKESLANAETIDGAIISRYRELARTENLWISLGGFHEKPSVSDNMMKAGERLYNTHLVISNEGKIHGKYSKAHLFDVDIKGGVRLKETDFTVPGEHIGPPVDTPVGRIGLGICYDLRFPELSIALTQQGAEILTYPSAFTVPTGMAHWHTLLRARAIENQCYVIAAAQVGKHNAKRSSYGHSLVVDPWGCVLAECQDQVDVAVAQIDLEYLRRRRLEMPVWSHRRPDLYGHIQVQPAPVGVDCQDSYQFGQVNVRSSQVFHRSALSYAFVNKKPVLPGHVLVSPLRPAERMADLTPLEVADLFQLVNKILPVIEEHFKGTSLTVAVQDGPDSGQTIKHVHVHVLPRKPFDFEKNDSIYDELQKHDKNVKRGEWRTDEAMTAEATELRRYFH